MLTPLSILISRFFPNYSTKYSFPTTLPTSNHFILGRNTRPFILNWENFSIFFSIHFCLIFCLLSDILNAFLITIYLSLSLSLSDFDETVPEVTRKSPSFNLFISFFCIWNTIYQIFITIFHLYSNLSTFPLKLYPPNFLLSSVFSLFFSLSLLLS